MKLPAVLLVVGLVIAGCSSIDQAEVKVLSNELDLVGNMARVPTAQSAPTVALAQDLVLLTDRTISDAELQRRLNVAQLHLGQLVRSPRQVAAVTAAITSAQARLRKIAGTK